MLLEERQQQQQQQQQQQHHDMDRQRGNDHSSSAGLRPDLAASGTSSSKGSRQQRGGHHQESARGMHRGSETCSAGPRGVDSSHNGVDDRGAPQAVHHHVPGSDTRFRHERSQKMPPPPNPRQGNRQQTMMPGSEPKRPLAGQFNDSARAAAAAFAMGAMQAAAASGSPFSAAPPPGFRNRASSTAPSQHERHRHDNRSPVDEASRAASAALAETLRSGRVISGRSNRDANQN